MKRARRCLAPTQRGGLCQNYCDTCPVSAHRSRPPATRADSDSVRAMARDMMDDRLASGTPRAPLADDEDRFQEMAAAAAGHYGLASDLVVRDYWLVRTLYAWQNAVGDGYVRRRYPNPERSDIENRVGRFVFGGGTSLSAAWGITQRWSEDIDLVLSPEEHTTAREMRQACMDAFNRTAARISGTYKVVGKGPEHRFATFVHPGRAGVSRMDVSFKPLGAAPIWMQREQVMSMIGRLCDDEMLEAHPELGGFGVMTLGPGTTAMNKLLAQAETSNSGDLRFIRERARDLYDLACIARDKHRFEGHIGRDSRALLHIAETWDPRDARKRPAEGFSSLRSFDSSTAEHDALAQGYEEVLDNMVWGEKIPLHEAIHLAVSLDPGPPQKYSPPEPNRLVAYPRN